MQAKDFKPFKLYRYDHSIVRASTLVEEDPCGKPRYGVFINTIYPFKKFIAPLHMVWPLGDAKERD